MLMQMPLNRSCDSSPARPRLATTARSATHLHQRPDRSNSRIPLRRVVGLDANRYVLCITGALKSTPAARLGQLPSGANVPPVRHLSLKSDLGGRHEVAPHYPQSRCPRPMPARYRLPASPQRTTDPSGPPCTSGFHVARCRSWSHLRCCCR